MPEALTSAFTTEIPASIGTAFETGHPEFSLGQAPAPANAAMTVAMAQKPRQHRKVRPADGNYDPAFPIPARKDTDHANEVFEHYKNRGEDPDHVDAHPAITEVDTPQDRPPMTLLDALAKPMVAATAETPGSSNEDPHAASKFYEFPEEPEEDKNAKPAMTDVSTRDQQQNKGRRNPRAEISLGENASRLKKRFLAALGGVGVRPTLAY